MTPSVSVFVALAALAAQVAPVPAAGSDDVPTDVVIVVDDPGADLDLVDDDGALVAVDRAAAVGDDFVPLVRVLPLVELLPQTHYTLFAVDVDEAGVRARSDPALTDFTTGDGPDDEAPVVDVSIVSVEGDRATLGVSGADDVVFVDVRENRRSSRLLPVVDGRVDVIAVSGAADVVLSVVAVDAAGNASAPVDVDVHFDVDPPCCKTDGGGCASSSSSTSTSVATSVSTWAFAALVVHAAFTVAADAAQPVLTTTVPRDGAVDVPTTPLLIVPAGLTVVSLRGPGGLVVDVDRAPLTLRDGAQAERLTPQAALTPNGTWQIVGSDLPTAGVDDANVPATFTTGDGADDVAPDDVVVSVGDGAESGGTVPAVAVSVVVTADEAIDVVTVDGAFAVLDDNGAFVVSSERNERVAVDVRAVDAAGNESDAVSVDVAFCVDDPGDPARFQGLICDRGGGCAATSSSSLLALLLLLLRRRARRPKDARPQGSLFGEPNDSRAPARKTTGRCQSASE